MFFHEMKSESHSVMSNSLWPHGLYSLWNSPGWNTGVGSLSLLQEIFPTQGLNPGLPHYRWILYQLSHKGSPRILEWVAYPFSSGSSQSRNQTGVSCIAGGFCSESIRCPTGKSQGTGMKGECLVLSLWLVWADEGWQCCLTKDLLLGSNSSC